jgi:hypothetical protein
MLLEVLQVWGSRFPLDMLIAVIKQKQWAIPDLQEYLAQVDTSTPQAIPMVPFFALPRRTSGSPASPDSRPAQPAAAGATAAGAAAPSVGYEHIVGEVLRVLGDMRMTVHPPTVQALVQGRLRAGQTTVTPAVIIQELLSHLQMSSPTATITPGSSSEQGLELESGDIMSLFVFREYVKYAS